VTKATVLYTSADASPQSGAFRSLLYMAKGAGEKGIRSLLVTSVEDRDTTVRLAGDNLPLIFLQLPRAKRNQPLGYYLRYLQQNASAILQLSRIIRREEVDVVHANEILDLYAALAAKLAGVPCVWHVRASFAAGSLSYRLIPRIAYLFATRIVTVSHSVRRDLFYRHRPDSAKIRVLHNPGPDPAEFHPSLDGGMVREALNLDASQPLVVLVAKLIEHKGHETFIRSVPAVVERFPAAKFAVVGGELPGAHHQAYAKRLRSLPGQLGVEGSVIFTGFRSDVPGIMAAADVVVHSATYRDPFPGVVLQGMATGKPVIATNLGGTSEQLEDGVSGVLIEPGDPALLAQKVIELLSNDERRLSLGQAAARRIQEQFTAERFFAELMAIYEELLAE
jgi:glycosyltransferase involved in cell wall biosynthesis